jgi:hypothetical protein
LAFDRLSPLSSRIRIGWERLATLGERLLPALKKETTLLLEKKP